MEFNGSGGIAGFDPGFNGYTPQQNNQYLQNNADYQRNQIAIATQAQQAVDQHNADWARTNPATDYGHVGGYPSFGEPSGPGSVHDVFTTGAAPYNSYGNPALGPQPSYFSGAMAMGSIGADHANDPATMAYYAANPDVLAAGMNAYDHWKQYGQNEGRQSFGLENLGATAGSSGTAGVDWNNYFGAAKAPGEYGKGGGWEAEYLLANPDVAAAAQSAGGDINAFADKHFQDYGQNEGRKIFDANEYLRENPDVAAAGMSPFEHYNKYGREEGRFAPMSGEFNPTTYLMQNPDVAEAGMDPFVHYMKYGQNEGRSGAFEGADDYASRGYMAGGDDNLYGNPTGVGDGGYEGNGSYYGSGKGNPWPLPPGADVSNPSSYFVYSEDGKNPWQDTRHGFYNDLMNDPDRMYQMAARGLLELGRDPEGRQGVFEAMFNQKAARPGLDPLRADYFPHIIPGKDNTVAIRYLKEYADTLETLKNDPQLLGRLYGEIGRAFSSNITQGATDWASGTVAANSANRTTETYKSPVEGERFFIKNIPNLIDGRAAGIANRDWLLGIQQQLPDYNLPEKFSR